MDLTGTELKPLVDRVHTPMDTNRARSRLYCNDDDGGLTYVDGDGILKSATIATTAIRATAVRSTAVEESRELRRHVAA